MRFHQEAFKQAPYVTPPAVFRPRRLDALWVMSSARRGEGGTRRRKRWRKGGWDNLNKTEGQSNNKTSIPPPPSRPDVNFLFLTDLGAQCEWGVGSWLVLNRPATTGLMEKAALWKIGRKKRKEKGIKANRHTHLAAFSGTVFLSRGVVSAATGMTKANYCCHFIKGIRLARAREVLSEMWRGGGNGAGSGARLKEQGRLYQEPKRTKRAEELKTERAETNNCVCLNPVVWLKGHVSQRCFWSGAIGDLISSVWCWENVKAGYSKKGQRLLSETALLLRLQWLLVQHPPRKIIITQVCRTLLVI